MIGIGLKGKKEAIHSEVAGSAVLFENRELFRLVCGIADDGVDRLENLLGVRLVPRGSSFTIFSDSPEKKRYARLFFERLISLYSTKPDYIVDFADVEIFLHRVKSEMDSQAKKRESEKSSLSGEGGDHEDTKAEFEKVFSTYRGRVIYPRTKNQDLFIRSINQNPVTFCLGPAGTGKTFLAIAAACNLMQSGQIERIILTRPAVEAGESLGFLPGDLTQKVDPYLRPVYDALYECIGPERTGELILERRIEIAPLAYMRGRTLNHSMVILDEAQNCTLLQLKMFLTRLGRNSRMCIGGDVTQIDLHPGRSGLIRASSLLRNVEGIGIVEFDRSDIIRNRLIERIVEVFERAERGEIQESR